MDIQKLLKYLFWAEDRFLQYCEEITLEQYHTLAPGLDKSAHDLFFHLYEVYWYWSHFLTDKDFSSPPELDQIKRLDLFRKVRDFHTYFRDYASSEDLTQTYTEKWDENDNVVKTTAENILFNFVTHGAYHRGQLALLLRYLGYDKIEETDFNPYIYKMGQK